MHNPEQLLDGHPMDSFFMITSAFCVAAFAVCALASNAHSQPNPVRVTVSGDIAMSPKPSEYLGNGYYDHGVATPISNHRGTVATVDGDGRNVVLLWLYDHRGCYGLLMIDAETGNTQQFDTPYDWRGDGPFASVLSSRNRFYSHFGSHLLEFDPVRRAFTFHHETVPQMAMSMTEADDGVIWSGTYPNSAVASYNPETGEFRDYGNLYKQNWRQYPRSIATDDKGWVYFGIGSTAGQIIVLNPETGEATPVVPESERGKGHSPVYRDMNGKVYGQNIPGEDGDWYELYGGDWRKLKAAPELNRKPIIASSQGLFHREFPDGKRLIAADLVERQIVIEDPATGDRTVRSFDYSSEGAHIMGVATAPNNTIVGGTAFPMRFFSYDPAQDNWTRHNALGQWNTVVRQNDRFFVGAYTQGLLQEWDPSREWVLTERGKEGSNPELLSECRAVINRPHDLLAHPDGKTIVMAGTPGYGHTGGGLLFWDRETEESVLLQHTDILPEHSTLSLAALPDGRLLGGSTTAAGTGGEKRAEQAELYIMDMANKKVEWHDVVFPGVQGYTDLCPGPGDLIYGFADRRTFFVFDPATRKVVHQKDYHDEYGSTTSQQGPRVFVTSPEGVIYVLFNKGIATVDQSTHEITLISESPLSISGGGDYLDGRVYFYHGSHVYSYQIPE